MCISHEVFTEIGMSSTPSFIIKDPPEDNLYKFRLKTATPNKKNGDPIFYYKPTESSLRNSIEHKTLLDYRDFKASYMGHKRIGQGAFAFVDLVRRRDGELHVAKTTKFSNRNTFEQANREFYILKSLEHPNTVVLIEGYNKRNLSGMTLTMEYLWGGQLTANQEDNLSEKVIIAYIHQILSALLYLHSKKIAHLDIRPENIIYANKNSRYIKIIDFGMARVIEQAIALPNVHESRDFMPPEMIQSELIDTYSDMWSLGVLTYWLLTGTMPFVGSTWLERSRNICQVLYCYEDTKYRVISDRAKTFVSYLLCRQTDKRMTAAMALNDEWIKLGPDEERPKKIPIRWHGSLIFVDAVSLAVRRWKMLRLVIITAVRFRVKRRRLRPRRNRGRLGRRN